MPNCRHLVWDSRIALWARTLIVCWRYCEIDR